jgi:hypothetical protein
MSASFLRLNTYLKTLVLAAACGGAMVLGSSWLHAEEETHRVYELRTYVTHEGKLEDLHRRFREHTTKLFEKHGMTNVGYWVPEGDASKNTLIYLLSYPNREAREKSWKAFLDDPDWKKAYAESHKNGPLVDKVTSHIMTSTDYSKMK